MKTPIKGKVVQDKKWTFKRVGWLKPDVSVDPALLDLARLHVAQIHQSPVGMEKHRLDLKARGESEERLDQLKTWRESSFFNDKEKAALKLSEAISLSSTRPILKQSLKEARHHFPKEELISLLLAIIAVNDWNHPGVHGAME